MQGDLYCQTVSVALAYVIATQIGNVFTQRSEKISNRRIGLGGNPRVWIGIAFEIRVLALVLYIPILQRVFGTSPLPPNPLWMLFAMISVLPLIGELRKALVRRARPGL